MDEKYIKQFVGVDCSLKVVIVGAGAIGLLIGSYLSERNHEITYITRSTVQAEKLRLHGITLIQPNGEKVNTKVQAFTDFGLAPTEALWIVAVKYHQLTNIEEELQSLPLSTTLVFIQNGLAHLQWINRLEHQKIYIATIEHGAVKQDATSVLHKGVGLTKIAPHIMTSKAPIDISIFQTSFFQSEMVDDAYAIVLRKVVLNACINPITAILQIKNGELITNSHAFHLMKSIFEEILLSFPEISQTLTFEDVKELCVKTSKNYSSMLQDRLNHRKSEIESIVGVLLQMATTKKRDLPLLRTLYYLVLAIDEKGESFE